MSRVRVRASKHELRVQREALQRFERYLPTLRLKQQQLQVELRRVDGEVRGLEDDEARERQALGAWIELWSEPVSPGAYLALAELCIGETNVAGVGLPTFEAVRWRRTPPPLETTPSWLDDALEVLERLATIRARRSVLAEQRSALADELRRTTQRVNLFEKVQIPAAREALRTIRIALGDQQAAEVVRAKIAKAKSSERERAT